MKKKRTRVMQLLDLSALVESMRRKKGVRALRERATALLRSLSEADYLEYEQTRYPRPKPPGDT